MIKNTISKIFKRKTPDEKIAELTNKLIVELKADGRSIAQPDVGKDFGSLYIWVHHLGDENRKITLMSNGWEINIKPTFTEF